MLFRSAAHPEREIVVRGVGGDTIENILTRMDAAPEKDYAAVLLAVGINDGCYQPSGGRCRVLLADYEAGLRHYVDWARRAWPRARLAFIGLTRLDERYCAPIDIDTCYLNEYAERYDGVLRRVAADSGVDYLAVPPLNDQDGLLPDGLHPNDAGHQRMYEVIEDGLRAAGLFA